MARYQIHPQALLDIDSIWTFIAKESFEAAERTISEIRAALSGLNALPYQGHRRPDLTSQPFRFIHVYDYLIAYAPDEPGIDSRDHARAPQPASPGCDSEGPTVTTFKGGRPLATASEMPSPR